ncbi:MAG: diaminopimelate epimerase [Clostridia bacterium]|nr:diaminopimelate epimerase [Clostridia bacterium]
MKFTKMHGAGNDFIIVNNIEEKIPHEKFSYIAKTLCATHTSIGADGFMFVEKADSEDADYKMLFYNDDGTLGEMCGNGARCIARYGYEFGLAGETQRIETTAGLVTGERITEREYKIRLNDVYQMKLDIPVSVDGESYSVSYVELGNPGIPHAVVALDGLYSKDKDWLRELGRKLRFYEGFPKGANVNFYEIQDDHVDEITFERGVEDFTLACGTGTGSMVSVLTMKNLSDGNNVEVRVPGGKLYITAVKDNGRISELYLTGPTNIVAVGQVRDEDLQYDF